MDSICQLTQLKQISLLKLPNQADPADAWLQFSKLTSLTALACHIPVDAAHQVSKFVKLKSLNLHPEDYQAPFDMNLYSTLTALEEVDLGTSFTKFPTTWTNLKRFKAMHARIDSNMNFDTLTCLRLFVADLDPGACHNLSKLTNLVELRLLDQTYYKTYTGTVTVLFRYFQTKLMEFFSCRSASPVKVSKSTFAVGDGGQHLCRYHQQIIDINMARNILPGWLLA